MLLEAAQVIREEIPVASVLSLYGYSLNRAGFMRCPFHAGDRNASFKAFDIKPGNRSRGWYCFGCNAGGSVIDFVMRHDGCDFRTAVRAIDQALSLNLLRVETWQEEENYRKLQSCLDDLEALLLDQLDTRIRFLRAEADVQFQAWAALDRVPKCERTADDWTHWLNLREGLYFLEDCISRLDLYKEDVKKWRNKHRLRPIKKNSIPGSGLSLMANLAPIPRITPLLASLSPAKQA